MTELKVNEITEIVKALEDDQDHRAMRDLIKRRYDLYSMRDIPELPEHMNRGDVVDFPSPMLKWLARVIRADILAYPTSTTVIPFGAYQEQADKLEKWLTLFRNRLDEGRRVDMQIRWHQLITGYGIMLLHCGEDEKFPWSMETPDPLTCFFPLGDGPMRPSVMARRYKMLVRQAEKNYSGHRGPFQDAKLKYDGANWDFESISDDYQADGDGKGYRAGFFEECEFLWLDDGEMIYHVALNKGSTTEGKVVWSGKNLTVGVSAVIVPGQTTPLRELSERFDPELSAVMQMVKGINRVRAMRLTRSEQMKPDMLVEQSPEQIAASRGNPDAAMDSLQMTSGAPNIVKVPGKPTPWVVEPDPDLDKTEQSMWDEVGRYINTALEVTQPETLEKSTANAILSGIESRKRQQSPMLANLDTSWKMVDEMAIHSMKEYDSEYELYSLGGERYGDKGGKEMVIGKASKIGPKDLDFEYHIKVETQSSTPQEVRMRVEDWSLRRDLGLSTTREGVTVAGYTDEGAQLEALAVDRGVEMVTPQIEAEIAAILTERIRMRSGLIVRLVPASATRAPPGAAQNGANPMQAPAIPGGVGGSEAA